MKVTFSRVSNSYNQQQARQNNVIRPQLKSNSADSVSFKSGFRLETIEELLAPERRNFLSSYCIQVRNIACKIQRHTNNRVNEKTAPVFIFDRLPADGSIGVREGFKNGTPHLSLLTAVGSVNVLCGGTERQLSDVIPELTDALGLKLFMASELPGCPGGKVYSITKHFDHSLPEINSECLPLLRGEHCIPALDYKDWEKLQALLRAVYW